MLVFSLGNDPDRCEVGLDGVASSIGIGWLLWARLQEGVKEEDVQQWAVAQRSSWLGQEER